MPRIFKRIREEAISVLPAILYFFFAINLFRLTFGWMMRSEGLQYMPFVRTIIASLIVGKIMIIADALPFLNKFSSKPLIYNTIWKTSIYSFFGFLFIFLEKLIPLLFKYSDPNLAWQHMLKDTHWPRFWSTQIWLVVLFLLFVVFRELHIALGKDKMRQIFFGK
ncbi:MAG: hypothetical protein WCY36_01980 [Candidatus Omnitrophota bacterium]